MRFLGPCSVCGTTLSTYRSLAGHLRHQQDSAHQKLKMEWFQWRSEYRATLRCRKCGGLWEITDKAQRNKKRCPSCSLLRANLGRRSYEKRHPQVKPDIRQETASGSKAAWDGLVNRSFHADDEVCQEVLEALHSGIPIHQIRKKLGVPYKVFRGIGQLLLGEGGYEKWRQERKMAIGIVNIGMAHEAWRRMSPAEKARELKKRFGGTCALEARLADQLRVNNVVKFRMNQWQAVPIGGAKVPREADIKIALDDGRKVVVFCDGEAFHGPKTIFGDPACRIQNDIQTAEAFFELGYSAVRYAESEINSGWAVLHLLDVLTRLGKGTTKICRLWHPPSEKAA